MSWHMFWFYDSAENRAEVAKDYAEQLQLENPVVVCEDVIMSCGCLVTHGVKDNRMVEKWGCCAGGCE